MGHSRYGPIPKTRSWKRVIGLLEHPAGDSVAVAQQSAQAAAGLLRRAAESDKLVTTYWLLCQLCWTAKTGTLGEFLQAFGIRPDVSDNGLAAISQLIRKIDHLVERPARVDFISDIAPKAMHEVLADLIARQSPDIFGANLHSFREGLKKHSSDSGFGKLSAQFFASLVGRVLRYFVSKEIPNHVGPEGKCGDVLEMAEFKEALSLYSRQAATIVERFSGEWFGSHAWKGEVDRSAAKRFLYVALGKFVQEIVGGGKLEWPQR